MFKKLLGIVLISFFSVAVSAQITSDMLKQAEKMNLSIDDLSKLYKDNLGGKLGSGKSQNQLGKSSLNSRSSSFRDTVRNQFSIEDLDKINPRSLERVIREKVEMEGMTQSIVNRGNLTSEELDTIQLYEPDKLNKFEIVIKDGGYVLRRLPLVYGREIFTNPQLSFSPNYNMATPVGYILGPGDEVVVDVWGSSEMNVTQKITPDGTITIQGIGLIPLAGYTVEEAQSLVSAKVAQNMGGALSKLSVGAIRTIKVNMSGEVMVPGTFTMPSFATLFNAMYMAGGVNDIGSLRAIRVYRNNKHIATMDLYAFLLNGDYEANIMLQDNDMIIVPPYENYVYMGGHVKRERVYELKKGETLSDAVRYSGGFTGDAYSNSLNVKRKTGRQYSIMTVDSGDFDEFAMNDGDSVAVEKIISEYSNRLSIKGAVWRPGDYEYSDSISMVSRLIGKAEGLKGNEFASRGQISRRKKDYTYELISFDIRAAVTGEKDIELQPHDEVFIPNILELRENYNIVSKGEVNKPDTIPYQDGMTIEDVIVLSGGLKESASYAKIEVARRIKDPNATEYNFNTAELFSFNIDKDLSVSAEAGRFVLHPFDEVFIRRSPGYSEQHNVKISGEVLFVGEYVIATDGERISDVIKKTGGFTPEAYVRGASVKRKFTADELAQYEAALTIAENNFNKGQDSLSKKMLNINALYSLGVDIEKAVANPGCNEDIILRNGDQIFVPKCNSTVKISGAVLYPNSVAYDGKRLKKYVEQAGGYNYNSRRKPYVIYMNGKVASTKGGLFRRYPRAEPGCQIVVPLKPDRKGGGISNVMGLMSSTTSLAAMIATLVNLK